nr:tetratricopeptide repeat protein [Pararoseomonas baculiformis]
MGLRALAAGQLDEAERAFTVAAQANPASPRPSLGLADIAWRRGQPDLAEPHFLRARQVAPREAVPEHAWGRFLVMRGRTDEAAAAFRAALERNPSSPARLDLADLLTAKGDPAAAEPLYREVLAREPGRTGARHALGNALLLLGRLDDARSELQAASEADPRNPLPVHLLGVVEARRGDRAAALAAMTRALEIEPRFAEAHATRGSLLVAEGQMEAALAAYRSALEARPGFVPALLGAGMIQQSLGRVAEAERVFRDVLQHDANSVVALNNLAWIAAESRRNLSEAEEWARRAASLAPASAEVRSTLGWVHRARGDLRKAVEALEAADRLGTSPAILVQLGTVYLQQGRRGLAAEAADRALRLDASNGPAQELRRRAG